jgi:hypothetical protein
VVPTSQTFGIFEVMPQNQIVGLALMAVAVIDTTVGNLLILPRIPDPNKRRVLRVAFGASGVVIAGIGVAIYQGILALS